MASVALGKLVRSSVFCRRQMLRSERPAPGQRPEDRSLKRRVGRRSQNDPASEAGGCDGGKTSFSAQKPGCFQSGRIAVTAPQITLPKGGGPIRGIGEKFATNPVTGTGSLTVPIYASPGRSGFGPKLSLSYDSGAGNGPFGPFGFYELHRYRPRVEGLFVIRADSSRWCAYGFVTETVADWETTPAALPAAVESLSLERPRSDRRRRKPGVQPRWSTARLGQHRCDGQDLGCADQGDPEPARPHQLGGERGIQSRR